MGTKVAATLNDELKPSYTVSTVLAASFVVADTDCAIFVGDDFPGGHLEAENALVNCLQRIRENGSVTPLTTNESYAKTSTTYKPDIVSGFDAVAVLPLETDVGIWYGPDFQQNSGSSITPFVKRLIEKLAETTLKAA
jgi:hypothetical protein